MYQRTKKGRVYALADKYSGKPASDPNTKWEPDLLRGNILYGTPANNGWACGGCAWYTNQKQYGRFSFTVRAFEQKLLSFHALLWPKAEGWPPEIDIAEMFREDRQAASAFLHYWDENQEHKKQNWNVEVDVTKPTKFSVEWRPESIEFFCNNKSFGKTTIGIPHEPMQMVIQAETHASETGLVFDSTRGKTDHEGPYNINDAIPVVEVLEVLYEPL